MSKWEEAMTREQWQAHYHLTEANGRVCIMRLLGKRCTGNYDRWGKPREDHQCHPPHGDHMHLWRDEQGKLVFTSQPYAFVWEYLQETVDFCRKWGLKVDIDYPSRAW